MSPTSKTPNETFDLNAINQQTPMYEDEDDLDDLQGLLAEEERAVTRTDRTLPHTSKSSGWLYHHRILPYFLGFLYTLRPATFDLVFKRDQAREVLRPSAYLDGLRGLGALSVYFYHTIGSHASAREGYGQDG